MTDAPRLDVDLCQRILVEPWAYDCDRHDVHGVPLPIAQLRAALSLLREAREALIGVVAVADRKTDEFIRARASIARIPSLDSLELGP